MDNGHDGRWIGIGLRPLENCYPRKKKRFKNNKNKYIKRCWSQLIGSNHIEWALHNFKCFFLNLNMILISVFCVQFPHHCYRNCCCHWKFMTNWKKSIFVRNFGNDGTIFVHQVKSTFCDVISYLDFKFLNWFLWIISTKFYSQKFSFSFILHNSL